MTYVYYITQNQGLGLYLIIKHTNVSAMKYTIGFKCDFFEKTIIRFMSIQVQFCHQMS